MNHLYQLLCVPKGPSVSIDDLKSGNLDQFLSTSMRSSASIEKDNQLKQGATQELTKLLRSRSNSPRNTLKMVNSMFENASQACHHSRERALIDWLQTCVSTAIQLSLDPDSVEKPRRVSEPKTSPKKNKSPAVEGDETDVSWEEDDGERYEYLGDSDEDYMPSDDGVVPTKKKKKSSTKTSPRKKKNQDQVVPPSPPKSSKDAVIPVLHEGAGAKALQKYFADLESKQVVPKSTSNALADGYFVRAFFFPSKDSFNAFMSALNSAKKTLDICVFAFTDDDVADALIAAKKRGVSIRIITDNQQAAGKGADAKRLQEQHGIPFKTDHTTGYMHNKFAIIDGATLINGSFNWSKGARFKNRENVLITNIPLCIQEFQGQFDTLWKEF